MATDTKEDVNPLEDTLGEGGATGAAPAKPNSERTKADDSDVNTDEPSADEADDTSDDGDTAGDDAGGEDQSGDDAGDSTDDENADDADGDEGDDKSEPAYDVEAWGTTGTEVGDSVLELLASAEMSPEDAKALMYDAIVEGDVTKIDKEALIEKIGKAKANLVLIGAKQFVDDKAAAEKAVTDTVYGVAGGKDNWEKVRQWGRDNITPEERAEYNDLFNAGGKKAEFAAKQMLDSYNADSKNTSVGKAKTVVGDGKSRTNVKGITRQQYAEQLERAHRTGDRAAIKKIQIAREAGRKAGI